MSRLIEMQQRQEIERRDMRIAELEKLVRQIKFDEFESEVYLTIETDKDWWDKRNTLINN